MNAVLNHIAVPFFQRVPTRGKPVVLAVFDGITETAWHHKEAFLKLSNDLRQKDIEPPTLGEFQDWYARVKNGLIERPHPSDLLPENTAVAGPYDTPFFNNPPARAKPIIRKFLAELLALSPVAKLRPVHEAFKRDLEAVGIVAPDFFEFGNWHIDVTKDRVATIDSGDSRREFRTSAPESGAEVVCEVAQIVEQDIRLEHAYAIVKAAHELNQAKLAAGFSPLSIVLDDTIVQEALRDILSAEADATVMDADVHMTPGNKLVDLLLGEGDDDIDAKLVDCLTIDMQAEICRILARSRDNKSL